VDLKLSIPVFLELQAAQFVAAFHAKLLEMV
jgi:hypothetical protein